MKTTEKQSSLSSNYPVLLIFDVFRDQIVDEVLSLLEEKHIIFVVLELSS